MLCRKKPSAVRRRLRRYLLRGMTAALILLLYFELAVRVQLGGVIRAQMCALAQEAVNTAVLGFLEENPDTGERLSELRFGDSGSVTALTTDPAYINYVKAQVCERAQQAIDTRSDTSGIGVPLGCFSGVALLDQLGPQVTLTVGSRSAVACSFTSSFETAGINQTLHHIALHVSVDIAVYSPIRISQGVQIISDFEIAQTVIVGSVPSYSGVVTY